MHLCCTDILAKSNANGRLRSYGLYSSSVSSRVSFYYSTASGSKSIHFPVSISDGSRHDLVLSVKDGVASLSVDDEPVGAGSIQGTPTDCGVPGADCILYIGQRSSSSGGTLRFRGNIERLVIFPTSAAGDGGGGKPALTGILGAPLVAFGSPGSEAAPSILPTTTGPLFPVHRENRPRAPLAPPSFRLAHVVCHLPAAEATDALDLLDPANNDGSIVPDGNTYRFSGSQGLLVTRHSGITSKFSVTVDLVQTAGTSGYLFAKTTAAGSRFYSLYSSAISRSVIFYYRIQGSTTLRNVRFPVGLSDGSQHAVLLSVDGTTATLRVDATTVGQATLDGLVDDCGAPSSDCQLLVGQRASARGNFRFFTGVITEARLFTATAL